MGGVLAGSLGVEKHMSMGGLEVVMTGDPAQIKPIGDERMWKPGGYTGKAKNKPRKDVEAPVDAPSVDKFVDMCRLFREEFEDVVILQTVHRSLDGDGSNAALSEACGAEQQRFLEVTGRMADLEWTREDHAWLSQRNRSLMKLTREGRAELQGFEDAPLLMEEDDGLGTAFLKSTSGPHLARCLPDASQMALRCLLHASQKTVWVLALGKQTCLEV